MPSKTPRGGAASEASTTGSGWDAVAKKKAQNEERRAQSANAVYDLKVNDGESTHIQFLEEDPLCLDVHQVKIDGRWKTISCQKATKRGCVLCDDKIKTSWKAAFLVLDFRGEWDKEKGRFKNVNSRGEVIPGKTPVERRLLASNQLALVIKAEKEKKGTITKVIYELSRTGSTARDTSYQISRALDDDDKVMRAIEWETKADLEESCAPPTDEQLARMGYDGSYHGDDEDSPKPTSRKAKSARYSDDD